jgi:hypothetical protein
MQQSNYSILKDLVEERVQQGLTVVLFEKVKSIHAKYGYKSNCRCDYCIEKRRVVNGLNGGGYNLYNLKNLNPNYRSVRENVIETNRIRLKELYG